MIVVRKIWIKKSAKNSVAWIGSEKSLTTLFYLSNYETISLNKLKKKNNNNLNFFVQNVR